MAITTLNLRALNRSDTATSGQVITATSATAADFQDAAGGAWNLLKTVTASGASDATFVHGTGGVDLATYKLYKFVGIDIDSSGDDVNFMTQCSDDTGSSYETSNYDTILLMLIQSLRGQERQPVFCNRRQHQFRQQI